MSPFLSGNTLAAISLVNYILVLSACGFLSVVADVLSDKPGKARLFATAGPRLWNSLPAGLPRHLQHFIESWKLIENRKTLKTITITTARRVSKAFDFAPTPSSIQVQLALIGSPLRAFQWAQDEHRTLSLSPQRVARKREVSEIWTIRCDNFETVRDRMSVTINH